MPAEHYITVIALYKQLTVTEKTIQYFKRSQKNLLYLIVVTLLDLKTKLLCLLFIENLETLA